MRCTAAFGGGALILLAGLGRLDALSVMPPEFAEPMRVARAWMPGVGTAASLALLGGAVAIGVVVGLVLTRWRRRTIAIGDQRAVLPRTQADLGWAMLAALAAGLVEELFFRLALPLLIAVMTGSGWAGFAAATLLFGFAHRYQGWRGVVVTALAGAFLASLYLASAELWLAIALHAALNLNAMVLRPWAGGLPERRPAR